MATMTQTENYQVVQGNTTGAAGSGALTFEFAVRITNGDGAFVGFLTRKQGGVRYFSTASGARKAITREKRGDYHR